MLTILHRQEHLITPVVFYLKMLKTLRLYSLVSPLQLHASRARSAFTKLQHHSQGTVVVDNQNDQHHHFVSCLLNSASQRDSAVDSGPSLSEGKL